MDQSSSEDGRVALELPIALKQGTPGYSMDHQPATLTWKDLTVTVNSSGGKVILNAVTGYVLPNRMLAIMGPSGSGKTTLLDTLAGRIPKNVSVSGEVLLNGRQSTLTYGVSSYVTQEEELVGVLTVRETLRYAALLRLPSSMSRADKEQRVDAVLQELGLVDAQDTQIGNWYLKGISGGQRKRVSIGCELVISPNFLFVDEPTSGLDAAAAFYVMATMRKLAVHNRTIVTVIHQPSSEVFDQFDQLALLSTGNVVYFGPAHQAMDLFNAAGLPCPAMRSATDHFLHVINQDFKGDEAHGEDANANTERLLQVYRRHLLPSVLSTVQEHSALKGQAPYVGQGNQANAFYQALVLTHRTLVNNWRNVGVFWVRLAMYIILCVCIGTVFLRLGVSWTDTYSRASAIMFVVGFLTFMAISGFPAFVESMMVFIRERLNGYYPVGTFVVADTVASSPFLLLIALSCTMVVYWLVGFNDDGDRVPYFIINLFAALLTVESLMMAIAAIVPHYLMGIAMGAGIIGIYMLVCGFFQPVSSLPKPFWLYPMHFLSYHTFAFGGFMRNEFEGTAGWGCPCENQQGGCGAAYALSNPCTATGQEVLDFFLASKTAEINKWWDVLIQLAMALGYRAIFWVLLVIKEKMHTS